MKPDKILTTRTIKVGKKSVQALALRLQGKNLVVVRGSRGYCMCGYLNLEAANTFGDVAAVVKGVTTIDDLLSANVAATSRAASKQGIRTNQAVKDVLKIIA